MTEGFIKLMRSRTTRELLQDGNAFLLLTLIAWRAKRTSEFSVHGLAIGQALIGDYHACGLTEQQYRSAKTRLKRYGLATFRATNKGTIATLLDTTIFDINEEVSSEPAAGRQRASNESATTNKNIKNEKNGRGPPSFEASQGSLKTFDEIKRSQARESFERARREFLADD